MSFTKRGAEGGWARRANQRATLHTWRSGQVPVKQCSPGSVRSWRNSTAKTLDGVPVWVYSACKRPYRQ